MEGRAGRALVSPQMVLTLWTYAISQGEGSARRIEKLTRSDDAYRWIVGDMSISHEKLSKVRAQQGAALDKLVTDVIAALSSKGLLNLDVVGLDGTRIRASAAAPSFRTYGSLLECRRHAELHLKAVLATASDPRLNARQRARRKSAALDYQRRVEDAIRISKQLHDERDARELRKGKLLRVSTTDSDARLMKMPDQGFRPAYNVQLAVAGSEIGGPRCIVSARVTNVGSDMGSLQPAVEQIRRRCGHVPKYVLADANHAAYPAIAAVAAQDVQPVVPVPKSAAPLERLTGNDALSRGVRAWRESWTRPATRRLYRVRSGLSELVNAQLKSKLGLTQFNVRGLTCTENMLLLCVVAFNLSQFLSSWSA